MINNTWHTFNESDTAFIFVHGFFSSSEACWTSKDGVRWPDLITTDDRLGTPSVFTAGYYTAVDSGDYKIADCARELYDALRVPNIGGQPAPLAKPRLVFVCHSLGGIVTRYMIERNREAFATKDIALILIASPSYGAALASSLRGLITIYKNRLAEQLTAANESLDDLDDRFKDLLANRKIAKLVGAEAYEHHFPIHWKFIPALRPLVSKSSASRYFGPGKLLAGTDHSTCVKPTSHLHVSHQFLVSTILDLFPPTSGLQKHQQATCDFVESSEQPPRTECRDDALFEVYAPIYEPYYLVRKIDEAINAAMKFFSVWAYGKSGVGKTASIHRATANKNTSVLHVYIGATADLSQGAFGLLREIYYTVAMKLGGNYRASESINQIIADIVTMLVTVAEQRPVHLIIDEVPLIGADSSEMAKFVSALHAILISTKQLVEPTRLRIIVTSIFDPQTYLPKGSERIFEQIKFVEFRPWLDEEARALVGIISSCFPSVITSESELSALLSHAQGSPRFIKVFFRNTALNPVVNNGDLLPRLKEAQLMLGQGELFVNFGDANEYHN